MKRVLKFLGWYIAASFAAALAMLLFAFPDYPRTITGWLVFFLLALPVTLVGEATGNMLWRNRVALAVEEHSAGQSLSWLRIAYGFVVMLLLFVTVWGLAIYFEPSSK
ncbi:MAG TPA: hypothetical protein VFK88_01095 [Gallionella sp.]|nr:hypothetical protein [Gallionella sp.]